MGTGACIAACLPVVPVYAGDSSKDLKGKLYQYNQGRALIVRFHPKDISEVLHHAQLKGMTLHYHNQKESNMILYKKKFNWKELQEFASLKCVLSVEPNDASDPGDPDE